MSMVGNSVATQSTAEGDRLTPMHGESARAQSIIAALESALAAHPDALRELLRGSSEALIAFDATRRIVHANRGAELLFGYDDGEMDGLSTDLLLPARMRQPGAPPMTPMTDVFRVDLPGLRKDGRELAVEWAFRSLTRFEDPIFVTTVRDRAVTERAIDALRASEERFRLLVDSVQEYAIVTLDPNGRVSSWNRGAERSKGWTTDEIVGLPYDVFFTPEDRQAGAPQRLLAAATEHGSHEVDGWRMRKDGSRFRANAYLTALRSSSGELRGFAKITRDLTARLQAEELERDLVTERAGRLAAEAAEQRVRASEERLRRLQRITAALSEAATPVAVASVVLDQCLQALAASGGAVYVYDEVAGLLRLLDQRGHPEGPLSAFQQLALDRSGPISDAARERKPSFYASLEACVSLYPALRDVISSGGFEASVALPLLTQGKLLGVLGLRFQAQRAFDENDRALLLTVSELCAQALDRARLFAGERAARADAEAANRSKDEFLAMLGHELRNPLAPIVTALTLMRLRSPEAPDKERTVIERQVKHLTRLVDDLLDVSRITGGKVELKKDHLELAVVVQRAVEQSSPLLEQRQQHLSVQVPGRGLVVHGDGIRLAQVVSNLLTNAAKYTPIGGHIEVAATRTAERIVLTVRDDGIGIASDMLARVFDLFAQERQSIDRSQGGLGLGLAIVRSLVTMHGGTVSVVSEGRGQGSVFTLELPSSNEPATVIEEPAESASPIVGGARRVLVVDDNVDAADLLVEVLRRQGFVVEVATDGPDALRLAATFRPELALLDIGLPVMDGYELARRMRETHPGVRLVAVTGYGQEADRALAREAGFDAHLVKPVQSDALQAALAVRGTS